MADYSRIRIRSWQPLQVAASLPNCALIAAGSPRNLLQFIRLLDEGGVDFLGFVLLSKNSGFSRLGFQCGANGINLMAGIMAYPELGLGMELQSRFEIPHAGVSSRLLSNDFLERCGEYPAG
jgi:hypothetical protein